MSGRCLLRLTRMSSMLECQEYKPQAGQTRIYIAPQTNRAVGSFTGQTAGSPALLKGHQTLNTCVRCSNVNHVSPFETLVSESNGHQQCTGR